MTGRKRDEEIREELKATPISAVLLSSTATPRIAQLLASGRSSTSIHMVSFTCVQKAVQLKSELQFSGT